MESEVARLQAGAACRGLPWLEGETAAKRKKRRTWSGAGGREQQAKVKCLLFQSRGNAFESEVLLLLQLMAACS